MEGKKNQQSPASKPSNNSKVGPDGLTKKERRALKVAAEGKKKDFDVTNAKVEANKPNLTPANSVNAHSISASTSQSSTITPEAKSTRDVSDASKAELKAQRKAQHEARLAESKSNEATKTVDEAASKTDLKAQRRAIQEAQRQAKVQKQEPKETEPQIAVKPEKKPEEKTPCSKPTTKTVVKHNVFLFNHLYETAALSKIDNSINIAGVHAAFVKLGAQYTAKTILGSNARCLALLSSLRCLVEEFTTPPKQEFCRSLESTLQNCVQHLQLCRPLAVSMMNALRHFKLHLTKIDGNLSDGEKRTKLLDCIETYVQDEIFKAGESISMQVINKIDNDDVILIYGCSSLIKKILLDAYAEGKKFKVIVVDARPLLEGTEMLRHLVLAGIPATYVLINAASFIMSRATKVLLGAHALLANGYVMSRNGTAQIALVAHAYNIPVLVCCETYKFCERVQTDSFVYNEIGDSDDLIEVTTENNVKFPLRNWRDKGNLTPLNLMYDVTPPDLVTAVVTELAILPCTSVPVILRIRPSEFI